jgi:hypothetical protein
VRACVCVRVRASASATRPSASAPAYLRAALTSTLAPLSPTPSTREYRSVSLRAGAGGVGRVLGGTRRRVLYRVVLAVEHVGARAHVGARRGFVPLHGLTSSLPLRAAQTTLRTALRVCVCARARVVKRTCAFHSIFVRLIVFVSVSCGCARVCARMHACVPACVYVCVSVRARTCVSVCACVCVCVHACARACAHVLDCKGNLYAFPEVRGAAA